MKTFTILLAGCLISTMLMAQQPYQLPFQELFNGIIPGTAYDESTLNDALSTKGWNYVEPLVVSPDNRTAVNCKTLSEGGYLSIPQLNVPVGTVLELNFVTRMVANDIGATTADKKKNNLHRNYYAVIGNDTIYDHQKIKGDEANLQMQNFIRAMSTYIYEGTSPVAIRLFARNSYQDVWENVSDGLVVGNNTTAGNNEGLQVRAQSAVPALNIAFGENINLGTIDRSMYPSGTVLTKSFTFKGLNLSNPDTGEEAVMLFDDAESTHAKLIEKSYSSVSGAIDAMVNLQLTVPQETGTFKEKITLDAPVSMASGATNKYKRALRSIWLNYTVENSTGIHAIESACKTSIRGGVLTVEMPEPTDFRIYNLTGRLVKSFLNTSNAQVALDKGVYLLRYGTKTIKLTL